MTIEEAEVIFGKRWNDWSPAEWTEFMRTVEEADLRIPLLINKAMEYYTDTSLRKFLTKSVRVFIEESLARIEARNRAEAFLEIVAPWIKDES